MEEEKNVHHFGIERTTLVKTNKNCPLVKQWDPGHFCQCLRKLAMMDISIWQYINHYIHHYIEQQGKSELQG